MTQQFEQPQPQVGDIGIGQTASGWWWTAVLALDEVVEAPYVVAGFARTRLGAMFAAWRHGPKV